jgi:S-adenosylmethionine:tRNA ribosyltransferase-isomerase
MDRSAFSYDLPAELIAQAPLPRRSDSRLLVVDRHSGTLQDRRFVDLPDLLAPGDLLVLNDTRVLPARLRGAKETGGRVELLLERIIDGASALFQVKASRSPRPGTALHLDSGECARVSALAGDLFEVEFDRPVVDILAAHGEVPLPPYIVRPPSAGDADRYQTVFAATPGAVAAPTAGLHFDAELLTALERRGVARTFVTLHVGAGTFAPLRDRDIDANVLHEEWMQVDAGTCATIEAARARGNRVVAVGTTVVRALETAASSGELQPFAGATRLFIRPGYRFRVVDAVVTNFHLPESSLLVLIAAFASLEQTLAAYRHAVAQQYRFFSYGDAMLLIADGQGADRAV